MAVSKRAAGADISIQPYRHDATRKNIPPAGLAGQGTARETPKLTYAYDPHLPPVLRSDPTGKTDVLPELLATAQTRRLTVEEAQVLAEALRGREPWLEWAGKHERKAFEVDPVALHIHERISAQAILKVAARENVQRSLFADPEQSYREAVQFYQHDVEWANRMILGDSLQVMASLTRREDLSGKVQMIYLDPPYGIKFASNFQAEIGKREVKDRDSDLTREPEMVKAYRDTWTLGVHSYLAYLRDRFILCHELLTDSGSIFVQISDQNLHRVRNLLDEVFGTDNFCRVITIKKTAGDPTKLLLSQADYILWYAKDIGQVKYRPMFLPKTVGSGTGEQYDRLFDPMTGNHRRLSGEEIANLRLVPQHMKAFRTADLRQRGFSPNAANYVMVEGREFFCGHNYHWKTNREGLLRLRESERLHIVGNTLEYRRYYEDWPVSELTNIWMDAGGSGFADPKLYVVQTVTRVITRCMLMTTDPSDLVLDPTCGSGTTAYVAEHWGRRWITIDTSRVALALARQRLLTAQFPFYKVEGGEGTNPSSGFVYKTVPHITLRSIAQNVALDDIFAKHQPVVERKLAALNKALMATPPGCRQQLAAKLATKEREEGKKSVTEADRRRWLLPKQGWEEWQVPFDADPDWPPALQVALVDYRQAWRTKMYEVEAAIVANAEHEALVDQPEPMSGIVRVSGPFTMEAVMPAEESLDDSPIAEIPDELDTFGQPDEQKGVAAEVADEPVNAEAYLDKMLRLLRSDGVLFPNNKVLHFTRLDATSGGVLHAEGDWETEDGHPRAVAVSFGPEYGPVTAYQVEEALPRASRQGFQDLVFAGFSFDGAAQAIIQEDPNPRVRCHLAHIRPDVNMGGLLKETPNSQIFTVFGSPRTELRPTQDGQYTVEMQGVDIYNPVDNTILPTNAEKVAAWFVDGDYDGYTFCITQAFFPDKTAWGKLALALKGVVDEGRFAALNGTTSLPFPVGKHRRVAVKVIDPRGNEVMRVHRLDGATVR